MSQIIECPSKMNDTFNTLFPKYSHGMKGSSSNYMQTEIIRFLDGRNKVHNSLVDIINVTLQEFKTTQVLTSLL